MATITGVSYPIVGEYVQRFFSEGKHVLVRPATVYKQLRAGMKLLFYQSRGETGYVGEARIRRVFVAEDPMQFFDTYGDAVHLARDELAAYREARRRRSGDVGRERQLLWVALELVEIRPYDRPMQPAQPVPAGGRYLTDEDEIPEP
jgi:hypothetical protein